MTCYLYHFLLASQVNDHLQNRYLHATRTELGTLTCYPLTPSPTLKIPHLHTTPQIHRPLVITGMFWHSARSLLETTSTFTRCAAAQRELTTPPPPHPQPLSLKAILFWISLQKRYSYTAFIKGGLWGLGDQCTPPISNIPAECSTGAWDRNMQGQGGRRDGGRGSGRGRDDARPPVV